MAEHVFLQEQQVVRADINEILDLSAVGKLEWGNDHRFAAIGSNVGYSMGDEIAVTRNLLEVRVGYNPDKHNSLNYLRLQDRDRQFHYIEDGSDEGLLGLATRLLRIGEIAVRTSNGRLSGTLENCGDCGRETGHIRLYDAPHGLAGAIMAGSARVECVSCASTTKLAA